MENLYWEPPSTAFFQSHKWYKPEDFPEPDVEVWDENWEALLLFRTYQTQWRAGPGGVFGLDFGIIHHALDRKGLQGDEYDEMIYAMRIIESAALGEFQAQREEQQPTPSQ